MEASTEHRAFVATLAGAQPKPDGKDGAPPAASQAKALYKYSPSTVNDGSRRQCANSKIVNRADYLPVRGLGSSRASTKTRTSPFGVSYTLAPSHSDPAVRFSMWI